jgi:hypothetical protein
MDNDFERPFEVTIEATYLIPIIIKAVNKDEAYRSILNALDPRGEELSLAKVRLISCCEVS